MFVYFLVMSGYSNYKVGLRYLSFPMLVTRYSESCPAAQLIVTRLTQAV